MERYTTNTMIIERKGIFDKNRKKRFELTIYLQGQQTEEMYSGNRPQSCK